LALIELQSAVYRRYRSKQIPEENLEKIQNAIEEQMAYFKVFNAERIIPRGKQRQP
jgi:hypothetical protein